MAQTDAGRTRREFTEAVTMTAGEPDQRHLARQPAEDVVVAGLVERTRARPRAADPLQRTPWSGPRGGDPLNEA